MNDRYHQISEPAWKTILKMLPNLLSFCLVIFLWHIDVSTIPHILGACKISLQQGRFTFRHDTVLQHLVLVLKSFLKDLPNNTTQKCNTIKFVKSGTNLSKINNISKDTLHLASDWIFLADVKGDYLFPIELALTELHPDIALFSKSSKRAVLMKLTSPSEENMENWVSCWSICYWRWCSGILFQVVINLPLKTGYS